MHYSGKQALKEVVVDGEALVRDYLGRLDTAASRLGVGRRAELAGEVRDHIATALTEAGRRDELTVRNVLERLGPPEEIVAAESEPDALAPSGVARSPWGAIEIIALLLLTVGGVLLPVIGPLLGLLFVWLSSQWTRRQKIIATAIAVVLVALPVIIFFAPVSISSTTSG
jgi:hypothetical protein